MQLNFLSPTKLETGRLCRARLKAKYDGDIAYEEEQGDLAKSGTLAHEACKLWYRGVDLAGVRMETIDQTFKAAIEVCHAAKDYDGKPNSQVPNSPELLSESRTMFESITAFYKRENIRVIAAERKYKGALSNGVPVSLIVDLIVDRGNGVCEIIDFKTGYITLMDSEMEDKDQVLMNLLAVGGDPAFAAFPIKCFRYFWVREGRESKPFSLGADRLADYSHWLALEWQSILDDNNPAESINRFCKSCPRRNNPEDQCKKYGEYLAEAYGISKIEDVKVLTAEDALKLSMDEIMARYDRTGSQIKQLEKNVDFLKTVIKGEIQKAGAKDMEGVELKASLVSSSRENFSEEVVLALCAQYGVRPQSVLTSGSKKVQDAFAAFPDAIAHLHATASKCPTSPWIKISSLSPKKKAARKPKVNVTAPSPIGTVQPVVEEVAL